MRQTWYDTFLLLSWHCQSPKWNSFATLSPNLYCLNNPLRYRDEDGEFFFGLVAGFFRGIFTWQNPFKTAWRTAVNETKIQLGLLKSDWSHGFFKGLRQLVSRFTWESLQEMVDAGVRVVYPNGRVWQK